MSRNRVTGMYSGLDTESLISQLVEAKSVKINNVKKEQMAITYKQDAWKELNTKVKSLFNTANNMRYQSAYSKKKTTVSDSSVATVVTSDKAMNAVQNLKITQLAASGYMTGKELDTTETVLDGEKATSGTKLADFGIVEGSKFTITVGGEANEIEITEGMTLGELANKLSEYGVTANFDAATQRFFIAAKESGKDKDFSITSTDPNGKDAIEFLGITEETCEHKVKGEDAKIELNGATFTSNSNTIEVNGLTITANALTTGEGITLKTSNDTSAIYDMVKKFINEYSTLINEMDKLYNVKADSKYKPLTDEEKAAMSDY
nr:flagellar filament capping protein FliD [Lachnospiraceae bacterium]